MIEAILSALDGILQSLLHQHFWLFAAFLFLIVTVEMGIIFLPFLPGDSLLFLTGTLISTLNINFLFVIIFILFIAAVLGDTINYLIGKFAGELILSHHLVKKRYLDDTHKFYEKYGNKVIFLARFIPIARSIAPFLAGTGRMNFRVFMIYNVLGGIFWVVIFTTAGYFFGNIPFVQKNLTTLILLIIVLSALPLLKYLKKSN